MSSGLISAATKRLAAKLAATGGAGLVGFMQAGANAAPMTLQDAARRVLCLSQFFIAGETDWTNAIIRGNAEATAEGKALYLEAGTKNISPAAPINQTCDWLGESPMTTSFVSSAAYGGEVFRNTGSFRMTNFSLRCGAGGNAKTAGSIGIRCGAADLTQFTGHQYYSNVWVFGFAKNWDIQNLFLCTWDNCRGEFGTFGLYAYPTSNGGDNGYFTTLTFNNCSFADNDYTGYVKPPVVSQGFVFNGGSLERPGLDGLAISNVAGTQFNGHVYCEGSPTIKAISIDSASYAVNGLLLKGTGGINIDHDSTGTLNGVRAITATDTLKMDGGTQVTTMIDCYWPDAGNTVNAAKLSVQNTKINGVHYQAFMSLTDGASGVRTDFAPQVTAVAAAGAIDVYRFLNLSGGVVNQSQTGRFLVHAVDNATGANAAVYECRLESNNAGTGEAVLTLVSSKVRGTNPGGSASPLTLADDGVGGAVKLQFTKAAALAGVTVRVMYDGISV